MKEDKLDSWLRESLDNYQPEVPETSKKKFLMEIPAPSSGINNRTLIILIASFLLLSVTGFILFNHLNTDSAVSHLKEGNKNIIKVASDNTSNQKSTNHYKVIKGKESEITKKSMSSVDGSVVKSPNHSVVVDKTEPEWLVIRNDESIEKIVNILQYKDNANIIDDSKGVSFANEEIKSNPDTKRKGMCAPVFEVKGNNKLLIYYRPELLYNVIENGKLIHNIGIQWQTNLFNDRYVIGTGIGLSVTKGYYEYGVEYNEYLGNYQHLDSVTFDWNPSKFSMQHTLHTSEEVVYDTLVSTKYQRVYRNFIYMQLPLTLGYELIKKENYSIGLRFEPILSILLSKKPVEYKYETGMNRLIQINRITPDRVRTNWQLNAGLCIGKSLFRNYRIELEPRISYYFNSVYEKSDNSSSPVGASIRVAVGFKY
jgi:hypothetical protein